MSSLTELKSGKSARIQNAVKAIQSLPAVPAVIRYLDEYDDTYHSIRTSDTVWRVQYNTMAFNINIGIFCNDGIQLFI